MSNKSIHSSTFAMDGFERPVALANSSTRALMPQAQIVPASRPETSSINGAEVITLRQLAQPKPGGIK